MQNRDSLERYITFLFRVIRMVFGFPSYAGVLRRGVALPQDEAIGLP